jgi:hypothetical protein
MPHLESAWREEIKAHLPQGCDYLELQRRVPDLSEWRLALTEEREERECLERWEAFIQAHGIAVPIEQAIDEDMEFEDEAEHARRLAGCPAEWRDPTLAFLRHAPEDIRMYLVYACYFLVQIERERRTGDAEWRTQAPSGSPEVLRELMFKWGPRFHRHRWTW